jgi:hypothetical protein
MKIEREKERGRTRRIEGERGGQRDPWNQRNDEGGSGHDKWDRNPGR